MTLALAVLRSPDGTRSLLCRACGARSKRDLTSTAIPHLRDCAVAAELLQHLAVHGDRADSLRRRLTDEADRCA